MSQVNVEELVSAYVNIRGAREELLKKFEAEDRGLKGDLDQLEQALLAVCNEINADSIKTEHGTATRKLHERFYCSDWENFKIFIKENDALDLFERRIHQSNFKSFMADHEPSGLPPGINVMREYGIVVRKASK